MLNLLLPILFNPTALRTVGSAITAAARAAAQGHPVKTVLAELGGEADRMGHDAPDPVTPDHVLTQYRPASDLVIDRSRRLANGQFIAERTKKTKIGLHFTAGPTADGAIRTFVADPQRVATAYVVDTDGHIYELFDPQLWAYSFGIKNSPHAGAIERSTVAIEIANWGPLKRRDETLYAWPPADRYERRYCHISETSKYVAAKFRGVEYFAAYPEAQIAAVIRLVRHLCERFDIPRRIPPPDKLWVRDVAFIADYSGVMGHQHVREKVDPGPALPWERLAREIAK